VTGPQPQKWEKGDRRCCIAGSRRSVSGGVGGMGTLTRKNLRLESQGGIGERLGREEACSTSKNSSSNDVGQKSIGRPGGRRTVSEVADK